MNYLILDCSVAITWYSYEERDEHLDYARNILSLLLSEKQDYVALVPPLWTYEIINVLVNLERRKKIPIEKTHKFLYLLRSLPISIESEELSLILSDTLELSRTYMLTGYDAAYLDLAMRKGLPIATSDKGLIAAMNKAGVPLMQAA